MNFSEHPYRIIRLASSEPDFIPITKYQFSEIHFAKKYLIFGMGIEEKADLIFENYSEYEKSLLDMALEYSIFRGKHEKLLEEGRNIVNRRIANLLTTTKLYLDQVSHDLSEIYGKKSAERQNFLRSTNDAYDQSPGYRVMDALRNHSQHRGLPTQGIRVRTH